MNPIFFTAPSKYPSAEAIFGAMKLAETILSDGDIRLGAFFIALKRGSTSYKYGAYVQKYWNDFRGVSNADLRELYEFTLLHLEKRFGPLVCRPHDNHRDEGELDWGYAERICKCCGTHFEGTARSWEDARVRRAAAFKEGHPDRTSSQILGVMPNTAWRIATPKVANAA